MALDKMGDWVLGRDYSAAPTCATCHISSYIGPNGKVVGNTKMNMVVFEDGFKENFPDTRALPEIGDRLSTNDAVVDDGALVMKRTYRRVQEIVPWQQRRANMAGVCANCHSR